MRFNYSALHPYKDLGLNFDTRKQIKDEIIKFLSESELNITEVHSTTLFYSGSRLYGYNDFDSDLDLVGFYIPNIPSSSHFHESVTGL